MVTDPARLALAVPLVRAELAAVDAACSRFRDDSELRRACAAGRMRVSPLLATLVRAAPLSAVLVGAGQCGPCLNGLPRLAGTRS